MAGRRHSNSISRTLLLPREHNSNTVATLRLRHLLAKDGCKESQVALAKSLLTAPTNSLEERSYNAQLAIHWLLQAVNTGEEEAFRLLEYCADAGVGINAVNSVEIEKCLKFSELEIFSRKVAFNIYRAIMSDTEELIPSDVFKEKIDLIFQEKIPEKVDLLFQEKGKVPEKISKGPNDVPLSFSAESLCQTKVEETNVQYQKSISFSDVVSSIQTCLESNVPLVSIKQVAHYSESKRWLFMKYASGFFDLVLQSTERLICELSSIKYVISVLFLIIAIEFFGCFYSSNTETAQLLKKAELVFVTSLCLFVMLSCTCYVITINFNATNMKRWLHLIKFFEPNIKSKEIESKFLSKTTCPFLVFLLTSFIYVAFLPENKSLNVFTDIGVLSILLMLLTDRTITHQRYFVNVSLTLNILSCLYKTNILQNSFNNLMSFLDLKLEYPLGSNFYLHISFISCLALPFVLPYLYLKMSLGSGKSFWHVVLLPHLMSVTWMNLAFSQLSNTTSTQNFLSVLSLVFILILSNYTGLSSIFIFYILINVVTTSDYFRFEIIALLLITAILFLIGSLVVKKLKLSINNKILSALICLSIFGLSYQTTRPLSISADDPDILAWEKYQTYCHHQAWYRTNTAEVQIACLPLKGRSLSFEGTVTSIEVAEVHNNMQILASILPESIANWFTCSFGEKLLSCDTNGLTPHEKEQCKMYNTLNLPRCHLHNWDIYKYRISLEISSRTSPEVMLIVDHSCSSFVRNLKEGDSVQAVGKLDSNIGQVSPILTMKRAKCTSCYSNTDCNINGVKHATVSSHNFSLKNIVWFYLSPFIIYEVK